MIDKIKALQLAEAANPESAGETLVDWSLAAAIARSVDAHHVIQVRNRDAFVRAGQREVMDFTALNSEAVALPTWKLATRSAPKRRLETLSTSAGSAREPAEVRRLSASLLQPLSRLLWSTHVGARA